MNSSYTHSSQQLELDLDEPADIREQRLKLLEKIHALDQAAPESSDLSPEGTNQKWGIAPQDWVAALHDYEEKKKAHRCMTVSAAPSTWQDFEDSGIEPDISLHWNDDLANPVMTVKVKEVPLMIITQNGMKPLMKQWQECLGALNVAETTPFMVVAIENWNEKNKKAEQLTLECLNYIAHHKPFWVALVDSKTSVKEMVIQIEGFIDENVSFESKVLAPRWIDHHPQKNLSFKRSF